MEIEQKIITWSGTILQLGRKLNWGIFTTSCLIDLYHLCSKHHLALSYCPQADAPEQFQIMRADKAGLEDAEAIYFGPDRVPIMVGLLRILDNQLEQRVAALERKTSTNNSATQTGISDEKLAALMARARNIGNSLENTDRHIKYHRHLRYVVNPDGTRSSFFTAQDALTEWSHISPYWYFEPDDSYELSQLEKFIEHDEKLYQIMQKNSRRRRNNGKITRAGALSAVRKNRRKLRSFAGNTSRRPRISFHPQARGLQ